MSGKSHPTHLARCLVGGTAQAFGFTLVELVIVVVIIGVVAAIAVPRFGNATEVATAKVVAANLRIVNDAIELYNMDHSNNAGVIASGIIVPLDWQEFVDQLTKTTDAAGDSVGSYGPYLRNFPSNPYPTDTGVFITATPFFRGEPYGKAWHLNPLEGTFNIVIPDSNAYNRVEQLANPAQIEYK